MSETSHTPGPWDFDGNCGGYITQDGDRIARAYARDDATLIATAPDLLIELKQARLYVKAIYDRTPTPNEKIHHDLTQINAVIAKAEGRS